MTRKVVYIGSNPYTAEYLLHSDWFELSGIICEAVHMTDEMMTFSLVRGIDLSIVGNKTELTESLYSYGPDYIYIMHIFGMRIPMEQLDGFRIYNIHPSMLPQYKGPHPTYWETVCNELKIGLSIHSISDALDEGSLISQYVVDYYIWENENDLTKKLGKMIPKLLEDLNTFIDAGELGATKVSPGDYYPKVSRKEVFIDLEQDSLSLIFNKVRAEAAYGGAKIVLGDKVYCLYHILFSNRTIQDSFIVEGESMVIRYRDSLVIVADQFRQLEGGFKFNYEK